MQLTVAITNPTTVQSKVPTIMDLFQKEGVQVVTLSETAATQHVQQQVSKKLCRKHVLSHWSPPAMPHRDSISDRLCERGKATGTAVFSMVPCRKARLPLSEPWNVCPRFVHTIVQIGQTHFQLCVVYGYSHSQFHQKASQQTEDLLQFVRDQILQVPLPYIICGDFNLEPTSMQSWHSFMQMGAVDLATIYQQLYHHQMPATCNQSTRPDTAIFSKELIPFVSSIRILGQQWFATHCPVLFTLTLPGPHLFTCRMRLPKTWCEFGPTEDNLAKALNDIGEDTDITTLAQWGKLVDDTVDAWLRSQNSEILPSKLPKQFRGRCQTPKIAKSPTFFSPP